MLHGVSGREGQLNTIEFSEEAAGTPVVSSFGRNLATTKDCMAFCFDFCYDSVYIMIWTVNIR